MAGHSKWNNIKHKKAKEDRKRAKIFSQIARKIRVVVKEAGSGNPEQNAALRPILDKARAANMPKDNICRAIDAGLGKGKNGPLQEVLYEGFGPNGVAFLITAVTDNKNRTTSQLRFSLSRAGGSLGSPGCVKYMFQRDEEEGYKCTIPIKPEDDKMIDKISELADELREQEDVEEVYCAIENI